MLCLLAGGLRIGELTMITRERTDFERGYFWIEKRKADQPKTFPLLPEAAAILRRRFLEHGGRAWPTTPNALSNRFCMERKRIKGVKRWDFHTLRHTAATWMQRAGVHMATVSATLGHSSIAITEAYLHTTIEQEREALKKAIVPKLEVLKSL